MKKLKYIGIFVLVFIVYHTTIGSFFTVDENKILQSPWWYAPVGILFSAGVAFCAYKAKHRKQHPQDRKDDIDIPSDYYKNNQTKECAEKIPLADIVSLDHTEIECEENHVVENPLHKVDNMDGHDFEYWCANLLRKNGFTDVSVTPGSGDQGVDIIAIKDGVHYAIQCKCYHSDLGNTPVQEVYAGKEFYRCQVGAVMTNRYFTSGAKELAKHTRVLLWDRNKLKEMLAVAGEFIEPETTTNECARSYIDDMFFDAVEIVLETGQASASMIQRRLKLDYARAAGLMNQMERLGVVGPFTDSKPRKILMSRSQWKKLKSSI